MYAAQYSFQGQDYLKQEISVNVVQHSKSHLFYHFTYS